jgi:hypothetical protein
MNRPEKPKGFHYLSHQSVDAKSGIITDVCVTPGNINDHVPYADRIKYQIETYGFEIREVGIDRGYDYTEVHKEMYDLGIKTYTPLIDNTPRAPGFSQKDFIFARENDSYTCPFGKELRYSSVNQTYKNKVYRASPKDCKACPFREKCFGKTGQCRTLMVPFFHEIANMQRENYGTERYYKVQHLRRIYCEGNFALQKDNHNLRRTKKRGNKNVTEHCLLSALALNLKRLVRHLMKNPVFFRYLCNYLRFGLKRQAF